jgi:NitT/TauT family transport system substrate-binding protein
MRLPLLILLAFWSLSHPARAEPSQVRLGLLKFGTVAWEIETIRHHGFDRKNNLTLEIRELASNEAAKIALQTGAVDLIVTDWVWVARQRFEGKPYTFIPYSRAVGAVLVPAGSAIRAIADLKGSRLGIAGGSLDKSWLLLRALVQTELGWDPESAADPAFAAPPLLSAEFDRGRLDAILTYWHYAARLEASGARPLISVAQMIERLGIQEELPMLGYAMREEWAAENPEAVAGFVRASRAAKDLLAQSEDEWHRLAPQIGAEDPKILAELRDGYRDGIPMRWGDPERAAAARLFALLAGIGGRDLVGSAVELPPGTFWPAVRF